MDRSATPFDCDLPRRTPTSGPSACCDAAAVSLRIRLVALPAILRLSSAMSSARDSDGDPSGEGEDEALDDRRRVRLLLDTGAGDADGETRVGTARRFSGVEGPALGEGE